MNLANQEGEVTWYTGMDEPSMKKLESAFEEQYPEINATFVRMNSSELGPRVDTERGTGSPGADVIHTSTHGYLDQVLADGQLAEIQSPAFEELSETVFQDHPGLAVDRWYAPFSSGSFTVVWNTDKVSEPIESYADLIDRADEFRGQIAVPDMYGDVVAGYYLAIQRALDGPDSSDPSESESLAALADMNPRLFESVVPLTNAVAAGEVKAGIYSVSTVYEALKEKGAPIDGINATDLDAKSGVNANVAIASWATNPNAAQVLVDFLFSEEGQAVTATTGYSTVRTDVDNPNGDIEAMAVPLPELDDPAFLKDYRANWTKLFRG
ncbi:ABC transporter substrate-binding protein [Dietzia sp. PP-33]|uniref:ABC transporter substrate-binding protein n=1 Tax=Dietzia sp. PP-33 TaxID=2957500 RepID=UPI0029B9A356|nr:extracellular solute-binding protein [Dietzia sp. PP-33]MDX2358981.1 extracellular solute-binding protein [Dietzia sp. PP-33]